MLIYVAARTSVGADPQSIVSALVLREADLDLLTRQLDAGTSPLTLVAAFVAEEKTRALLTVAASRHFPSETVTDLNYRGLYARLNVLMDWGLRPSQDWPSMFVRTRGDNLPSTQAGLISAARDAQKDRFLFINAEANSSAGLMCAESVLDAVAGSYRGEGAPHELVDAFRPFGRPSGWIHYTLDPECPCPGCSEARRAVLPPPPTVRDAPAIQKVPLRLPTSATIRQLAIPAPILRALEAGRIRTIQKLESLNDRQLLRVRNIGRKDVEYIRSALSRYKSDQARYKADH